MCYAEMHRKDAALFLEENKILQKQLHDQKDEFDIRQESRLRDQQLLQAKALGMKDSCLKDTRALVRDKSDHIVQLDHENQSNANRADVNQNVLGLTIHSHTKLRSHGEEREQKAKMWKEWFDKLPQQLLEEKCNSDQLSDQLEEWRRISEETQGKY